MREENGYGERAGEIATELAHHYTHANEKKKAIHYFQLAGEQAAAKGADSATACAGIRGCVRASLRSYWTIRPAGSRKCDFEF